MNEANITFFNDSFISAVVAVEVIRALFRDSNFYTRKIFKMLLNNVSQHVLNFLQVVFLMYMMGLSGKIFLLLTMCPFLQSVTPMVCC